MILFSMVGVLIIGMFIVPPGSDAFIGFVVFASMCSIITLAVNAAIYCEQVNNIENIEEAIAKEVIYKEKATVLTAEFKLWLGEKYPEIEKSIFSDLIPSSVSVFAVSFPEIKSSGTIMLLVNKINALQISIYAQKLNVERFKRNIRVNKRNPWVIRKMMPIK